MSLAWNSTAPNLATWCHDRLLTDCSNLDTTPKYDGRFAQGYFLTDDAANSNARCLDGTPALYYHRKGTGSGANKWFLHQQGGGWCYDLAGDEVAEA
jgi:hypothetical protein